LRLGAAVLPAAKPFSVNTAAHLDCAACQPLASADRLELLTSAQPARLVESFSGALELPFAQGATARLPVRLAPLQAQQVGLRVTVPAQAKRGASFIVDLLQRENGKVVGGVALRINVR
jgi:hypothetical protein